MMNPKKMLATVVLAALPLTALAAFSNVKSEDTLVGGRIHDDFNRQTGNKNIYAENYSSSTNLLVRIKLSEYLELNGKPLVEGTVKNDRSTWTPFVLDNSSSIEPDEDGRVTFGTDEKDSLEEKTAAYRDFVGWTLGGRKVFLPTFNQNQNDLSMDTSGDAIDQVIAASVAQSLGTGVLVPKQNTDAYFTESQWQALSEAEQTGYQQLGIPWSVEGTFGQYANALGNGTIDIFEDGQSYSSEHLKNHLTIFKTSEDQPLYDTTTMAETSVAKKTLEQDRPPMSMSEWETLTTQDEKVGNYWVIDTDGWAYWANFLSPKEATSLLVNQVSWNEEKFTFSETSWESLWEWYYGVDVVGEIASVDDEDRFDLTQHGSARDSANALLNLVVEKLDTGVRQAETFGKINPDWQIAHQFSDNERQIHKTQTIKYGTNKGGEK